MKKGKTALTIGITSIFASLSLVGGIVLSFAIFSSAKNTLPKTQITTDPSQPKTVELNNKPESWIEVRSANKSFTDWNDIIFTTTDSSVAVCGEKRVDSTDPSLCHLQIINNLHYGKGSCKVRATSRGTYYTGYNVASDIDIDIEINNSFTPLFNNENKDYVNVGVNEYAVNYYGDAVEQDDENTTFLPLNIYYPGSIVFNRPLKDEISNYTIGSDENVPFTIEENNDGKVGIKATGKRSSYVPYSVHSLVLENYTNIDANAFYSSNVDPITFKIKYIPHFNLLSNKVYEVSSVEDPTIGTIDISNIIQEDLRSEIWKNVTSISFASIKDGAGSYPPSKTFWVDDNNKNLIHYNSAAGSGKTYTIRLELVTPYSKTVKSTTITVKITASALKGALTFNDANFIYSTTDQSMPPSTSFNTNYSNVFYTLEETSNYFTVNSTTGAVTCKAKTPVGSYPLHIKAVKQVDTGSGVDTAFNPTITPVTFIVSKASSSINDQTYTFEWSGEANKIDLNNLLQTDYLLNNLGFEIQTNDENNNFSISNNELTLSPNALAGNNSHICNISWRGSKNYLPTSFQISIILNKKTLSGNISYLTKEVEYGYDINQAKMPAIVPVEWASSISSFSLQNSPNFDSVSSTGELTPKANLSPGTYTAQVKANLSSPNITPLTYVNATFIVKKKTTPSPTDAFNISLDWKPATNDTINLLTQLSGCTLPFATGVGKGDGFAFQDGSSTQSYFTITDSTVSINSTVIASATPYVLNLTWKGNNNYNPINFTINLTIQPIAIPKLLTYDTASFVFSPSTTHKIQPTDVYKDVNGNAIPGVYSFASDPSVPIGVSIEPSTGVITIPANTDVTDNSVPLKVHFVPDNSNYNTPSDVDVSFSITKKELIDTDWTYPTNNVTTYGNAKTVSPSKIFPTTGSYALVSATLNNDTISEPSSITVDSATGNVTLPATSGVGEYKVTVSFTPSTNYETPANKEVTITVNKATINCSPRKSVSVSTTISSDVYVDLGDFILDSSKKTNLSPSQFSIVNQSSPIANSVIETYDTSKVGFKIPGLSGSSYSEGTDDVSINFNYNDNYTTNSLTLNIKFEPTPITFRNLPPQSAIYSTSGVTGAYTNFNSSVIDSSLTSTDFTFSSSSTTPNPAYITNSSDATIADITLTYSSDYSGTFTILGILDVGTYTIHTYCSPTSGSGYTPAWYTFPFIVTKATPNAPVYSVPNPLTYDDESPITITPTVAETHPTYFYSLDAASVAKGIEINNLTGMITIPKALYISDAHSITVNVTHSESNYEQLSPIQVSLPAMTQKDFTNVTYPANTTLYAASSAQSISPASKPQQTTAPNTEIPGTYTFTSTPPTGVSIEPLTGKIIFAEGMAKTNEVTLNVQFTPDDPGYKKPDSVGVKYTINPITPSIDTILKTITWDGNEQTFDLLSSFTLLPYFNKITNPSISFTTSYSDISVDSYTTIKVTSALSVGQHDYSMKINANDYYADSTFTLRLTINPKTLENVITYQDTTLDYKFSSLDKTIAPIVKDKNGSVTSMPTDSVWTISSITKDGVPYTVSNDNIAITNNTGVITIKNGDYCPGAGKYLINVLCTSSSFYSPPAIPSTLSLTINKISPGTLAYGTSNVVSIDYASTNAIEPTTSISIAGTYSYSPAITGASIGASDGKITLPTLPASTQGRTITVTFTPDASNSANYKTVTTTFTLNINKIASSVSDISQSVPLMKSFDVDLTKSLPIGYEIGEGFELSTTVAGISSLTITGTHLTGTLTNSIHVTNSPIAIPVTYKGDENHNSVSFNVNLTVTPFVQQTQPINIDMENTSDAISIDLRKGLETAARWDSDALTGYVCDGTLPSGFTLTNNILSMAANAGTETSYNIKMKWTPQTTNASDYDLISYEFTVNITNYLIASSEDSETGIYTTYEVEYDLSNNDIYFLKLRAPEKIFQNNTGGGGGNAYEITGQSNSYGSIQLWYEALASGSATPTTVGPEKDGGYGTGGVQQNYNPPEPSYELNYAISVSQLGYYPYAKSVYNGTPGDWDSFKERTFILKTTLFQLYGMSDIGYTIYVIFTVVNKELSNYMSYVENQ